MFAAARISFRARLPAIQAVPFWADATADVAVACVAAFTAAPVVTLVDQAVTRAAAGTTTLGSSLLAGIRTLFTRPHHAIGQPAFWLVFGVYGCTYGAATDYSLYPQPGYSDLQPVGHDSVSVTPRPDTVY